MSANFRNQLIFSRISCLDRSMVSLGVDFEGKAVLFIADHGGFAKDILLQEIGKAVNGIGGGEQGFSALLGRPKAAAPAMTVLPTPPLPPKKMYFNLGWSFMNMSMLK